MQYSEQEILHKLQQLTTGLADPALVRMSNYQGVTSDTKRKYTEIIAEWLINNPGVLNTVGVVTRKASYKTAGHTGNHDNPESNRLEEMIAMHIFRLGTLQLLGKVLDYQTPLRDKINDTLKAVDLLTIDGSVLRLVELKAPDSAETMLRCILEVYAYRKTVDASKLLGDFLLPADTEVRACVLVADNHHQHKELKAKPPFLTALMQQLGVEAFTYVEPKGHYSVFPA